MWYKRKKKKGKKEEEEERKQKEKEKTKKKRKVYHEVYRGVFVYCMTLEFAYLLHVMYT